MNFQTQLTAEFSSTSTLPSVIDPSLCDSPPQIIDGSFLGNFLFPMHPLVPRFRRLILYPEHSAFTTTPLFSPLISPFPRCLSLPRIRNIAAPNPSPAISSTLATLRKNFHLCCGISRTSNIALLPLENMMDIKTTTVQGRFPSFSRM